ncbi:MAG: hypothetical protein GY938_32640 [Ketobacter sp.]|nr:hypothetical protein [Ketobacter sp.]
MTNPTDKKAKTNKQLHRLCVNHWKRMKKLTIAQIRNGVEKPDSDNCAFCGVYNLPYGIACSGCPIFKHTYRDGCGDTPYDHAAELYHQIKKGKHDNLAKFREAVQAEIDFLESLEV